jgi:hypothetical protein
MVVWEGIQATSASLGFEGRVLGEGAGVFWGGGKGGVGWQGRRGREGRGRGCQERFRRRMHCAVTSGMEAREQPSGFSRAVQPLTYSSQMHSANCC